MEIASAAILPQLIVNGLIAGAMYSLTAAGFSLVYATNRFLNLAHGGIMMVGAYLVYTFFNLAGLNFYAASFLAVICTSLFGGFLFVSVYRPLRQKKAANMVMLIAAAGLAILLEALVTLIFGTDVKQLNFISVQEGWHIAGAIITPLQLVVMAVSAVLLVSFAVFMKYSSWGKLIRAVADNADLARTTGINPYAVQLWSFVIACAIASVAGILIGLERNIEPRMGLGFALVSFASTVVGGMGSLPGAILGSYLIGLAENVGQWILPSGYKEAIWLVMLFLFLLIRPSGIFGTEQGVRQTKL
ncbi:MAG: branched-chain amino acid ABC transporter permease [Candidatus Magasanikbacteria bacterium]|nr:branched-chain amino acid ABC transporter permease [Candidatus Magasanikbacteria bacterium]